MAGNHRRIPQLFSIKCDFFQRNCAKKICFFGRTNVKQLPLRIQRKMSNIIWRNCAKQICFFGRKNVISVAYKYKKLPLQIQRKNVNLLINITNVIFNLLLGFHESWTYLRKLIITPFSNYLMRNTHFFRFIWTLKHNYENTFF